MKKDVLLDGYEYHEFKSFLKRNKNPIVVPFYVLITESQYSKLNNKELNFLKQYYTKEADSVYTSNVIFITKGGKNTINNWKSFLVLDKKSYKIIRKLDLYDTKKVKDENDHVYNKFYVSENGNHYLYDLKQLLNFLMHNKFFEKFNRIKGT